LQGAGNNGQHQQFPPFCSVNAYDSHNKMRDSQIQWHGGHSNATFPLFKPTLCLFS